MTGTARNSSPRSSEWTTHRSPSTTAAPVATPRALTTPADERSQERTQPRRAAPGIGGARVVVGFGPDAGDGRRAVDGARHARLGPRPLGPGHVGGEAAGRRSG